MEKKVSFLPRIEFEDTILSSAKWFIRNTDLKLLTDSQLNEDSKIKSFLMVKLRLDIPDKFLVVDGDNELLIDSNNTLALRTFFDLIKNKSEILLEEFLYESGDGALVRDTVGNSYANECISVILNDEHQPDLNLIISPHEQKASAVSTFALGSEWIYLKIYCGVRTADVLISNQINILVHGLLADHIIDKWFFIRYSDPNNHIRLRIHAIQKNHLYEIIKRINSVFTPLINDLLVNDLKFEIYKREVDRYGYNSMELSESLFYNDSEFVIGLLNLINGNSGETIRWEMAMKSTDEFMNDFGLTIEEKLSFSTYLASAFFKEHFGDKRLRLELDNKFRKLRPRIDRVLNKEFVFSEEYYPIVNLIRERSNKNMPIIDTIISMKLNNQLQVDFLDLVSSYIHMNLDRLFMGKNRTNEFVLYDLLSRHYKSLVRN